MRMPTAFRKQSSNERHPRWAIQPTASSSAIIFTTSPIRDGMRSTIMETWPTANRCREAPSEGRKSVEALAGQRPHILDQMDQYAAWLLDLNHVGRVLEPNEAFLRSLHALEPRRRHFGRRRKVVTSLEHEYGALVADDIGEIEIKQIGQQARQRQCRSLCAGRHLSDMGIKTQSVAPVCQPAEG